jgi:hypothetical protein
MSELPARKPARELPYVLKSTARRVQALLSLGIRIFPQGNLQQEIKDNQQLRLQ